MDIDHPEPSSAADMDVDHVCGSPPADQVNMEVDNDVSVPLPAPVIPSPKFQRLVRHNYSIYSNYLTQAMQPTLEEIKDFVQRVETANTVLTFKSQRLCAEDLRRFIRLRASGGMANDEVINFFVVALNLSPSEEYFGHLFDVKNPLADCSIMTTFFYPKLEQLACADVTLVPSLETALARWLTLAGLSSLDLYRF